MVVDVTHGVKEGALEVWTRATFLQEELNELLLITHDHPMRSLVRYVDAGQDRPLVVLPESASQHGRNNVEAGGGRRTAGDILKSGIVDDPLVQEVGFRKTPEVYDTLAEVMRRTNRASMSYPG